MGSQIENIIDSLIYILSLLQMDDEYRGTSEVRLFKKLSNQPYGSEPNIIFMEDPEGNEYKITIEKVG